MKSFQMSRDVLGNVFYKRAVHISELRTGKSCEDV